MIEQIAHVIFDILVSECAADGALRDNFVVWYQSGDGRDFCFGGRLGSGTFERTGVGRVGMQARHRTPTREAVAERANRQLLMLHHQLRHLSPVERMDWFRAQEQLHAGHREGVS